ncbi:MAG: cytochrome P450 [Thermoactinospora sp.]|nr:cytochrome P450 [Thermoactinospora sp.]
MIENFPFPTCPMGRPHEAYDRRRTTEPTGRVRLPSGDVVVLTTRHDDAVAVLSDPRFSRELFYEGAPRMYEGFSFTDVPGLLISTDPPAHTRLRKLLAGTFTPRRIELWRPRVRAIATGLLEAAGDEFDFVSSFAFPLPVRVICDVLGVEVDIERVAHWSDALLSSSGLSVDDKLLAGMDFHAYVADLVARHRDDPGDGVLASLILARDEDDRLSEEELVQQAMGLLLAGYETTGSLLSRIIVRLLDDGWERLVERPGLIPAAVEELLRVEFPGDSTPIRVALEDVELPSGGVVAKGEGVIVSYIGANNDPSVFDEPGLMRFDREGPVQHLAFSRGIHYCLGANLARMELQEALAVLTERAPGLGLAGEVPWTDGSQIFRPARVPVRVG